MEENQTGVEPQVEGSGEITPTPQDDSVATDQSQPVSGDTANVVLEQSESQDAKSQAQAFYAMRKKIEELESRVKDKEVATDFSSARNLETNQSDVSEFDAQFEDFTSGVEFDESDVATKKFLTEAERAKKEARDARQAALQAQAQLEDFEAWQKYPFLKPGTSRTEVENAFLDDVKAQYVAERAKATQTGKRAPRLIEVADRVKARHDVILSQAQERAAAQLQATEAAKATATLESEGTRLSMPTDSTSERITELRRRVNMGDVDALTELNKLTDPFLSRME